jgi:general secretion pathway protein A
LTSIRGSTASLVFGEKKVEVSLSELSTIWTGEFNILWQSPDGYQKTLTIGDRGVAVVWLATQLKQLVSDEIIITSFFDQRLLDALVKYQKSKYLKGDGIAGMRTILNINSDVLDGIPRLLE